MTATERKTRTVDNAILAEVENLRPATLAALREKYREVFQEETRSRHREHLFRRIAWRLQALAKEISPNAPAGGPIRVQRRTLAV